ncbi:hypothetical protein [Polyangium aurulentum]|uniref:hypothetical protein n=1 Tax=Polyangium aurulentum TaxID=2567896 RepID=UPI0010AEC04A|nr:hypothetical protein [Polyangium aurulentum]UQA56938.1 hypothetical protein E8A73_037445 [Polyangium aurulentum]
MQTENVLSLSLAQDFGLHRGTNACSMRNQIEGGFACFRASGTQYHGTPLPGSAGDIRAFPQLATTRLLGGYDRVLWENVTLGIRLGWVLRGGGPRPDGAEGPSFLPFHGEARAGYTFGRAPFEREGWRFSLFAGGGIAQVDTAYRLTVTEDPTMPPPAGQLDNPSVQQLAVYRKSGTGFFGGGAALAYALSRRFGVSLGAKVMRMFPSGGTVLSLELGGAATF